eukprot:COSAG01_NODE_5674_length_4107_cov_23.811876_7_plen_111_part_00
MAPAAEAFDAWRGGFAAAGQQQQQQAAAPPILLLRLCRLSYSSTEYGPAVASPLAPQHTSCPSPHSSPPAATTWTSARELRRWTFKGMKFRFCGDLDVSRHNQIRAVGPC